MEDEQFRGRRCSVRASDLWRGHPTLANVYAAQAVKEAEDIEEPEHHGDDDHAIENRLDVALHGDEAIHKPEQNAHDDERDYEIDKWHTVPFS